MRTVDRRRFLAAAAAALARGGYGGPAERPPSIVLISIDTLRADHLGCYGYKRDTSPRIDRLARQGVVFRNCLATSSWTKPSHASMLTGLYPNVHGAERMEQVISAGCPSLASVLKARGYVTWAVVSTAVLKGEFGFGSGFDLYDDFSVFLQCDSEFFAERSDNPQSYNRLVTARATTRSALQFLRKNAKPPFFLFLHYWDCHDDYLPPKPYNRMFDPAYSGRIDGTLNDVAVRPDMPARDLAHLVALYDGEIRWVDHNVGQVLDALQSHGIEDQCAVVVTADHGEEFFEHGGKDHASSLFEELIRVPLIIRCPNAFPAGRTVDVPVSGVDLFPTICELAGAKERSASQGVSLVSVAAPGKKAPVRPVYSYLNFGKRRMEAVRDGDMKLIFDAAAGRYALYALGQDPGETRSVLTEDADAARKLVRALRDQRDGGTRLVAQLGLKAPSSPPALSAETIKQLRGIGYWK